MNAMRNTSTPKSSSTRLRPAAAAIAAAVICVAAGASHIGQPSFATTNGGNITALDVALTEDFNTLASAGTGIAWSDNFTIPGWWSTRTTYNSGTGSANTGALYSFGVAVDRAPGLGRLRDYRHHLPGSQPDEQHGRDDYVARHQLRGRAVAQWRERCSPHARSPVPGRQRRRHHGCECSSDRLDDVSCVGLHGPRDRRGSRRARRQRPGEPRRHLGHNPGDDRERAADLVAVAGPGRYWKRSRAGHRRFLRDGERRSCRRRRAVGRQHDSRPPGGQRRRRLEHRHQLQRERQRDRKRVRPPVPRRRTAGICADHLARELVHPESCCRSAVEHDLHGDGKRWSDFGCRHGRSPRLDGIGFHLLVHDGWHASARTDERHHQRAGL